MTYKIYLTNFHFYSPKNYLYSKPVKGLQGYQVGYDFAFNGVEKDDEAFGIGIAYSTFFRELDTRLSHWLSLDPETKAKSWESPYVSMGNTPIWHNDQLGNKDNKPKNNNKNAEVKEHKKKVETDIKNTNKTVTPKSSNNSSNSLSIPFTKFEIKFSIGAQAGVELKKGLGFDLNARWCTHLACS